MNKRNIILLFLLSGACGIGLSLYVHDKQAAAVNDAPVIQTVHSPTSIVKQLANDKQAGEKIFTIFCATCHAAKPAIDTNAPRINDRQKWQRLRKTGVQGLLPVTLRGAGAMPARGGCFECSDEQLRQTIRYILDQSK